MIKNFLFIVLGIVIGICASYVTLQEKPEILNYGEIIKRHFLEQSNFEYLNNSINLVIRETLSAEKELKKSQNIKLDESLHHTMNSLIKLKVYYLPMTKVRQLIYDAERLFTLNKTTQGKNNLKLAKLLLEDIGKHDSTTLRQSVNELHEMIDVLILGPEESPDTALEKIEKVGKKASLMLLKGEIILSGINFDK